MTGNLVINTKFWGGPLHGTTAQSDQPTSRAVISDLCQFDGELIATSFVYLPVYTDGICQVLFLHSEHIARFGKPHH